MKAKIDFAFEWMRTIKTEKERKKDKYYNIDSNSNSNNIAKKCIPSHKLFNAWLKFILVQFLISMSYKMNFDFDFIQILSMGNKCLYSLLCRQTIKTAGIVYSYYLKF